jgi:hypothetical protein
VAIVAELEPESHVVRDVQPNHDFNVDAIVRGAETAGKIVYSQGSQFACALFYWHKPSYWFFSPNCELMRVLFGPATLGVALQLDSRGLVQRP